ncbi:MAG: nicotinate-nucleotide--dimethylbenzimidazole phosphoribosyltransferase [Fimbriimonadaceae bacterium]|nr:nicotinate-nucleotide--dimethylbenzimidazole phosphoribosyltransferase [Fimbriimonadaceae bacterium]
MGWQECVAAVRPGDSAAVAAALARQDRLTKPPGSLGRLEALSAQLAGIAGGCPAPVPQRPEVIIFAGDHGVVAQGVSAFPPEVTPQMVLNFLRGGAAINVLARQLGATVTVVDAGVAVELPPTPGLVRAKIAAGTADFSQQPAMTVDQAQAALELGVRVTQERLAAGCDLLACGEMGIGNTTPAAAITAVCTGRSPQEVTGPGTGLAAPAVQHKAAVIAAALRLHGPTAAAPLELLAAVGGFELGALAGALLAAAAARVPVVVDGFIATAGALLAVGLCPGVRDYLIGGHCSQEPGHRAALQALRLEPLLDLGLRLGEGTGAVLACHLVIAAARLLAEMATFAEAGVAAGHE